MSSEPIASGEPASEPRPADDFAADAELVLAGLRRMEAVVRGERAALGRLREGLAAMADVLRAGKSAPFLDESTAALLDELEHRLDALIEVAAGGNPAPAGLPAASDDAVPTVSDVVSRLGRGGPEEAPAEPAPAGDVPTVSMLKGMVQALSAEAPPPADATIGPEDELLASVAELQARPVLPSEVGSAVIFAAPPPPEAPEVAAGSTPEPEKNEPPYAPDAVDAQDAVPAPEPQPVSPAPAEVPPDPDSDLSALLFGPDLDPPVERRLPPAPETPPSLPAVDLMSPTRSAPPAPADPSAPPDPLAPIKAMSEEERLALFS